MIETVIYIFLAIGVFFNGLGSFGLIRFPDVYTRLHAATKCTTFGS
ncbi:MAG: monovalent cation/H(+) antiporter subunit G, partial [Methanomicrobia archaeon]|nr:monovalent cation/H(+) antiporter subunit G [Methanomicrobia archaeon]